MKPTTGSLPDYLVDQMVRGAHELLKARWDEFQTATKLAGGSSKSETNTDDDAIIRALNKKKP
jgi:hypothetical protein